MLGMGFCCCPTGCVYFSDTFDRADSTNLGANWTELFGDWSIASNCLQVAVTGASAYCLTLHPTSQVRFRVTVAMKGNARNDSLRVYLTSTRQAWLEVIFGGAGEGGRLRLYDQFGTLMGSCDAPGAVAGSWIIPTICSSGDHVAVIVGGTVLLSTPVTLLSSSVGLGTGTVAGAVQFNDFKLELDEVDQAGCPACGESFTLMQDSFGFDSFTPAISPPDWNVSGMMTFYAATPSMSQHVKLNPGTVAIANVQNNYAGADHRIRVLAPQQIGTWYGTVGLVGDYVDANNYVFLQNRYDLEALMLGKVTGGVVSILKTINDYTIPWLFFELAFYDGVVEFTWRSFFGTNISWSQPYAVTIAKGGISSLGSLVPEIRVCSSFLLERIP